MRTNKTWIVAILAVVFAIVAAMPVMASDDFEFNAAFGGAWFFYNGTNSSENLPESLATNIDLANFGLSALMNMKFFKDFGATLGLEIDDPTFKKMVDFLGYLNIKSLMLKFDYHSFGGDVKWMGALADSPIQKNGNPVQSYDFRVTWTNFSILYDFSKLLDDSELFSHNVFGNDTILAYGTTLALGAFVGITEIPSAYQAMYLKHDDVRDEDVWSDVDKPGFGVYKSTVYGLTAFFESIGAVAVVNDPTFTIWFFLSGFLGLGPCEFDKDAIKRMEVANADQLKGATLSKKGDYAVFGKIDAILGVNKRWDIGNLARLDLALGFEALYEGSEASTGTFGERDGVKASFDNVSVGLTTRLGMKF